MQVLVRTCWFDFRPSTFDHRKKTQVLARLSTIDLRFSTIEKKMTNKLAKLAITLEGEFYYDKMMRILYATDASVYRELPLAVAIPKNKEDVKKIIVVVLGAIISAYAIKFLKGNKLL